MKRKVYIVQEPSAHPKGNRSGFGWTAGEGELPGSEQLNRQDILQFLKYITQGLKQFRKSNSFQSFESSFCNTIDKFLTFIP
jgi:hypothetical protein